MGLKECDIANETFSLSDMVRKMIGHIRPVGETNEDNRRLENLKRHITLVENLLADIHDVARDINRYEYSISHAGKVATRFLEETKSDIECLIDN